MLLVMIKPSQFPPFAFAFDTACRPAGIVAVAGIAQQHVQQRPDLRHRQRRRIFFFPAAFPKSKTIVQ